MTDPVNKASSRREPAAAAAGTPVPPHFPFEQFITEKLVLAVQNSKKTRKAKIKKALAEGVLSKNEYDSFSKFKKSIRGNHTFLLQRLTSSSEEEYQVEVERKIRKREAFCQEFGLSKKEATQLFAPWKDLYEASRDKIDPESYLLYTEEQILNYVVNRMFFLKEVNRFVEEKKEEIFSKMGIQLDAKIEFKLEVSEKGDSHNVGRLPLKILFQDVSQQELVLYYKPRVAEADKLILEAFRKLINPPPEEAALSLPIYHIESFPERSCSIWEAISGKAGDETESGSAGKFVLELAESREFDKLSRAVPMLRDLERVCSYLGVTDLHVENCIFKEDGSIVPIDLEVINPKANTTFLTSPRELQEAATKGIHGFPDRKDKEFHNFSPYQRGILDQTKIDLAHISWRILPAGTKFLNECLQNYLCFAFSSGKDPAIIEEIKKGLSDLEYEVTDTELLTINIMEDFLNREVPFFTLMEGKVYHGDISRERMQEKRPIALQKRPSRESSV